FDVTRHHPTLWLAADGDKPIADDDAGAVADALLAAADGVLDVMHGLIERHLGNAGTAETWMLQLRPQLRRRLKPAVVRIVAVDVVCDPRMPGRGFHVVSLLDRIRRPRLEGRLTRAAAAVGPEDASEVIRRPTPAPSL